MSKIFGDHRLIRDIKRFNIAKPVYNFDSLSYIRESHLPAVTVRDKIASRAIKIVRGSFDLITGYKEDGMSAKKWLNRIIFLETVAGVPGMVGGMHMHLSSLRHLEADPGWVHHLLEEAENERMHLFIFLTLKNPSNFFKFLVTATQFTFFNFYFLFYLIAPKYCHRFIG